MRCNEPSCDNNLKGRQTKFCCKTCQLKDSNARHQSYVKQQERGRRRKLRLVSEAGGCCSECGYNKNLAALSFHHKDPSKKSFQLDMRSLSNRTWEKCAGEAKKCSLLCHNCHMELNHQESKL